MNLAIVAVAYNRTDSLQRLIKSLQQADYEGDKVDLIVSIDNSGSDEVEKYVRTVQWDHGELIIKTFPKNLGLREHILTCGDYVCDYDAIAVLEDDLYVAPTFYGYMKRAVEFYKDDMSIAGISLYSHRWNSNADRPFLPGKSGYDNFFMQYAQSWGQIWLPRQWKMFREWYEDNRDISFADDRTPQNLLLWPKSSWLKYHIKYCIEMNRYFVYPYFSFTTNFVEVGQHYKNTNRRYQVELAYGAPEEYRFAPKDAADAAFYDAFFERKIDRETLSLDDRLVVDLYSTKNYSGERYCLTTKALDRKVIKSYGLYLRPQEMNVLFDIPGDDIMLYDMSKQAPPPKKSSVLTRWDYESRVFDYAYIRTVMVRRIINKFKRRLGFKVEDNNI